MSKRVAGARRLLSVVCHGRWRGWGEASPLCEEVKGGGRVAVGKRLRRGNEIKVGSPRTNAMTGTSPMMSSILVVGQ